MGKEAALEEPISKGKGDSEEGYDTEEGSTGGAKKKGRDGREGK